MTDLSFLYSVDTSERFTMIPRRVIDEFKNNEFMRITDAKEAYLKIRNLIEDNYSCRCFIKLILRAPMCEIKNGKIYQIFHSYDPYGIGILCSTVRMKKKFINAFANTFSDSFVSDGMYYLPDDSTRLIRANSFIINIDDFLVGLSNSIFKTHASSCMEFAELDIPLHSIKICINEDRIINSIRPFINSNDILEKRIHAVVYCEKEPMFVLN